MKVIDAKFFVETRIDGKEILTDIERYGRVCYKSEDKMTESSSKDFVRMIIKRGHLSVLEHKSITVRIICDRGISHEIVRHRIASYSQESSRFCNYSKGKFGKELTFIRPSFWKRESWAYAVWLQSMQDIEDTYLKLVESGSIPQEARCVLPNSLKTEIVMTMNLREWRHFFKLRASVKAHPQMREIAIPLLERFQELIPVVFEDAVW